MGQVFADHQVFNGKIFDESLRWDLATSRPAPHLAWTIQWSSGHIEHRWRCAGWHLSMHNIFQQLGIDNYHMFKRDTCSSAVVLAFSNHGHDILWSLGDRPTGFSKQSWCLCIYHWTLLISWMVPLTLEQGEAFRWWWACYAHGRCGPVIQQENEPEVEWKLTYTGVGKPCGRDMSNSGVNSRGCVWPVFC